MDKYGTEGTISPAIIGTNFYDQIIEMYMV